MTAVVELLQVLIRNGCVSSGFPSSGREEPNARALVDVLHGPGLDVHLVELTPGRPAVVARINGTDPAAESLALLAHTDVVPAGDGWTHDPFGGELVRTRDGLAEVWGRGAVDMLNQTAAMAIALRRLADDGFHPRGDLVFIAVPDEECGGLVGMKLLAERHPELVSTTHALTEIGGPVRRTSNGLVLDCYVGDRGAGGLRVLVRGTSAHASAPWDTDNALIKAAEVVRRLVAFQPQTRLSEVWRDWVGSQPDLDRDLRHLLLDETQLRAALPTLPPELARLAHACTHTTVTPTMISGGDKVNTIPDLVELMVDIRPVFGEDLDELITALRELLRDLVAEQDVQVPLLTGATASSPRSGLWDVLQDVASEHHPGARLVPALNTGQTDARHLRPRGTTTYGFGVLSERISATEYWARFHGVDERIDVESLDLSVSGWRSVCTRFLA